MGEDKKIDVKGVSAKEKAQMSAISKIDDLNIVAHNHFMISEFDEAIEIAEQMIELAKGDNLQSIVEEKEAFIQEIIATREKKKKILAIKELAEDLKKRHEAYIANDQMMEAHKSVETFVAQYENEANLREIIPVRVLINKDRRLWDEFMDKQNMFKSELASLEAQTINALKKGHLGFVNENLKRVKEILPQFKIEDFTAKWQEIEQNYTANIDKASGELAGLEAKYKENREKNLLTAALNYCENIISIAQASGKGELESKYSTILEQLKKEIGDLEAKQFKDLELLTQKAKELGNVIHVEENVLPLVEDFSIDELLGDLSSNMDEMLEQVGSLLGEHRVEIKTEIGNKAIITSASGEVVELEQKLDIKQQAENDVNYSVQSGLVNPFDDAIEAGIITDLIPYNFEISEIKYNGQKVDRLPDNFLTKDGLELRWDIENVPPKEKVEINYDLRRRVSRTIILIREKEVKIIKTHSNLSKLDLEGLYDAKLPFTNSFGVVLEGVVIEDIIPLYYVHFVQEPEEVTPNQLTSSEMGELVKWNIGTMEPSTLNYHYKLLELYRLEEIKIDVNDLDQKGLEAVNKGNIIIALENYKKIKDAIIKFIN